MAIQRGMTISQLCLVSMMKYVSEEEMKLIAQEQGKEEVWKCEKGGTSQ